MVPPGGIVCFLVSISWYDGVDVGVTKTYGLKSGPTEAMGWYHRGRNLCSSRNHLGRHRNHLGRHRNHLGRSRFVLGRDRFHLGSAMCSLAGAFPHLFGARVHLG